MIKLIQLAQQSGYKSILTTEDGTNLPGENPFKIKRVFYRWEMQPNVIYRTIEKFLDISSVRNPKNLHEETLPIRIKIFTDFLLKIHFHLEILNRFARSTFQLRQNSLST